MRDTLNNAIAKVGETWQRVSSAFAQKRSLLIKMCAVVLLVSMSFMVVRQVNAQIPDASDMASFFAEFLVLPVVGFFGNLLLRVIDTILSVAQYSGFTDAIAVQKGWTIVRDLTNMFFIVVLLYIAFNTMFGREQNWQASLTRLLIAALVINFSRTICGLLIDFSQVAMFTFVNGLKDAAGGNFVEMLQLQNMVTPPATAAGSPFEIIAASLLALTMVFVSLVITTMLLVFLVVRIVYLWILIILSPLAFFLKLSPLGGNMWGKWWSKFKEQVLTGPILAFFLWLSLLTSQQTNGALISTPTAGSGKEFSDTLFGAINLQGYIVGLALLVVSMMAAREVGGSTFSTAEGFTRGALNRVRSYGKTALRTGIGAGKLTGKGLVGAGGLALAGGGLLLGGAGKVVNRAGGYIVGGGDTRLTDYAYKAKKKLIASGVGKKLGMNEDYNKQKATEKEIKEYERLGEKDKAAELKKKLQADLATQMEKKYKPDQLNDKLEHGMGEYEAKGAMLAMAAKKDTRLFGQGADISKFIKEKLGKDDTDFEKELRAKLKEAGDENAMLGFEGNAVDQIKEQLEQANGDQKGKMFASLARNMVPGANGKAKDAHAFDKLRALDNASYDEMKAKGKSGAEQALAMAVMMNQGKPEQQEFLDKMRDLGMIVDNNMGAFSAAGLDIKAQATINKSNDKAAADRAKVIKKGGDLHHAVQGFNEATGNAGLATNRGDFRRMLKAPGAVKDVAGGLKATTLSANKGNNDVGRIMMANMTVNDLQEVGKAGKADQMFALVANAREYAKGDYLQQTREEVEKTLTPAQIAAGEAYNAAAYKEAEQAYNNARDIIDELNKANSDLGKQLFEAQVTNSTLSRAAQRIGGVAVRGAAVIGAPIAAVMAAPAIAAGAAGIGASGLIAGASAGLGIGGVVGGSAAAAKGAGATGRWVEGGGLGRTLGRIKRGVGYTG